jgi:hypothetical protein
MALAIYKWCNLLKFDLMLMALLLIISLLFYFASNKVVVEVLLCNDFLSFNYVAMC